MAKDKVKLPGTTLRNTGIILFVVGVIATVTCWVITFTGVMAFAKEVSTVDETKAVALKEGTGTVNLKTGQIVIVGQVNGDASKAKCEMKRPDGQAAQFENKSILPKDDGFTMLGFGTGGSNGEYKITCTNAGDTAAVPISEAASKAITQVIIAGVLSMFVWLLPLVGLILWIVGAVIRGKAKRQAREEEQRAAAMAAGYPGTPMPPMTPGQVPPPAAPNPPAGPNPPVPPQQ